MRRPLDLGRVLGAGVLLGTAPLAAPAQSTPKAPAGFVHEVWTVRDGLPVNAVNAVRQGRRGYRWLATWDGLVRFDGARFTVFSFSRAGDTLWLTSAANGVYRLDPVDGRITGHLATATPARGLVWTPDGRRLLVSGRDELLLVDPGPIAVTRRYGDLGVGQILYSTMTPDGARVLAPAPRDSQVVVLDVARGGVVARLRVGASPIRVVVAPDGERAFVANADDDHVSVVDLRRLTVARFGAAGGPNGVAAAAVPLR